MNENINFIDDDKEFDDKKEKMLNVFQKGMMFENKLFKDNYSHFLCFEFDFIFTDVFYLGIQNFVKQLYDSSFIFYVLSPDSEDYFYKHFFKYNVADISLEYSYSDFLNFIHLDPGGSPADCMWANSETILFFSNSLLWGMACSKDWEIGIVGFSDEKTYNIFIDIFKENVGDGKIFDTIDSYMNQYNKQFHWCKSTLNKWNVLKNSYMLK